MLSGEGNKNGEKNSNRSNQQKNNFARAAHFFCTFLCRCFARLQRETSRHLLVRRFMQEMSYVFSFTFFSLPLIFTLHWWPLEFLILSPPLQNFHVVLLLIALFLVELRWPAAYFSFSLSFSCSIFQICGHDNYSKLNTLENTDTETYFRFPFSSSLTLQFSLLYKTRVAMRFPIKITSSCIWVAIPVD